MSQSLTAAEIIAELSPGLETNRPVYNALMRFYSDSARISTDCHDLRQFLHGDCLYRVVRCQGATLLECALDLIDNHAECCSARGMLRYYETPAGTRWTDCEAAEQELGDAFTMDIYQWEPDSFTLFDDSENGCSLVAIVAFD